MLSVFKYPIFLDDKCEVSMPEVSMPEGAQILTVQTQQESPQLWALVDPDAKMCIRKFRICGTGHNVEETNLLYINSFQLRGGSLVFHLFEIP